MTFSEVVDVNMPQLETGEAVRARALDWVEANPYEVTFLPQLAALAPDRNAQFAVAMCKARANADNERGYFRRRAEPFGVRGGSQEIRDGRQVLLAVGDGPAC